MSVDSISPVLVGDRAGETLVVIPAIAGGGTVSMMGAAVTGAAILDEVVANPDGSRWVWVAPTGAGLYGITVG